MRRWGWTCLALVPVLSGCLDAGKRVDSGGGAVDSHDSLVRLMDLYGNLDVRMGKLLSVADTIHAAVTTNVSAEVGILSGGGPYIVAVVVAFLAFGGLVAWLFVRMRSVRRRSNQWRTVWELLSERLEGLYRRGDPETTEAMQALKRTFAAAVDRQGGDELRQLVDESLARRRLLSGGPAPVVDPEGT